MKENEFKDWLVKRGMESTANSRISNCKKVQKGEGDLDEHFERDKCSELILKLKYSKEDERNNKEALPSIPIDGNLHDGYANLKKSVKLYRTFRMELLQ